MRSFRQSRSPFSLPLLPIPILTTSLDFSGWYSPVPATSSPVRPTSSLEPATSSFVKGASSWVPATSSRRRRHPRGGRPHPCEAVCILASPAASACGWLRPRVSRCTFESPATSQHRPLHPHVRCRYVGLPVKENQGSSKSIHVTMLSALFASSSGWTMTRTRRWSVLCSTAAALRLWSSSQQVERKPRMMFDHSSVIPCNELISLSMLQKTCIRAFMLNHDVRACVWLYCGLLPSIRLCYCLPSIRLCIRVTLPYFFLSNDM